MLLLAGALFLDWATTAEVSVGPLYLFVVAYAAWNLGKLGGVVAAIVCAGGWMLLETKTGLRFSRGWVIWTNGGTRFSTYLVETYFVTQYRQMLEAHRRRLASLETVMAVCPRCGRIGPQGGEWLHVEELHKVNHERYKLCPICTATSSHAAANPARSQLA